MKIEQNVERVLISAEELSARIKELGAQITADYKGEPLTIVCILKGAVMFFAELAKEINLPLQMDFMRVSSYYAGTKSTGAVKILLDLDEDITGRHILLVEDIVDSGNTLAYLQDYLRNRGAKSVNICALLNKPARRRKDVHVNYAGFVIPDEFIIGYGLDYAEDYRNLPYIGVLKRSVYEKSDN